MSLAEIEAEFADVARLAQVPFALVAFDAASRPTGVCSLRDEVFLPYPHVCPWLRGLYVLPARRGNGIVAALLSMAVRHAAALGLNKLFAATHSAIGTFERASWHGFDQMHHDDKPLSIFAKRVA